MLKQTYTKKIDNMIYVKKDLFLEIDKFSQSYNVVVPHVCNNKNIFGGGFTAGIVKHYPIVSENYYLLNKKSILGYTQFVTVKHDKNTDKKIIFANMIAQNGTISNHNKRPLNYYALAVCMKNVYSFIKDNLEISETQIHCPKFGSGLAGGDWRFVSNLIEDIWTNIPIYIYQK